MAQAFTFRAFGAETPRFETGSELLGYWQSSAADWLNCLLYQRANLAHLLPSDK